MLGMVRPLSFSRKTAEYFFGKTVQKSIDTGYIRCYDFYVRIILEPDGPCFERTKCRVYGIGDVLSYKEIRVAEGEFASRQDTKSDCEIETSSKRSSFFFGED